MRTFRFSVAVAIGLGLLAGCTNGNPDGNHVDPNPIPRSGPWAGGVQSASLCSRAGGAPMKNACVAPVGSGTLALAICGDLQADNTVTIDARHAATANLAVDGTTTISSPLTVGGWLSSRGTIDSRNTLSVSGDLSGGDDWLVSSPDHVGGNASIVGTLAASNTVAVDGTLAVGLMSGTASVMSAGEVQLGGVQFTSPMTCDNAPSAATIATTLADHPDTASDQSLPLAALENLSLPTVLTLGCGQYHLSAIGANNTLTVHITGPTVLLVDGDVRAAAPTVFDIADGGSLELVIGGSLLADNTLRIGDAAHAAWIAVAGDVRIASPTLLYGALIAADSSVALDNTLELHGSAIIGPTRVGSPLTVLDGPSLDGNGCVMN